MRFRLQQIETPEGLVTLLPKLINPEAPVGSVVEIEKKPFKRMERVNSSPHAINALFESPEWFIVAINKHLKTNDFEEDVRSGYYKISAEFFEDFEKWLLEQGVPSNKVKKVKSFCWMKGHSDGYSEVLSYSYDVIDLVK
jgi:intein/homing endonuclease